MRLPPIRRIRDGSLAVVALAGFPGVARAGMPMPTFTEVARLRFEAISFFLGVLLLCAWAVQALWNGLRRDLPKLPRLSFGKALGVLALWGLLFTLVLTMISGARELLTPGAWVKHGLTYKLADAPDSTPPAAVRRARIAALRDALGDYARAHDGRFPPETDIPDALWQVPGAPGVRYLYRPGRKATDPGLVAHEPGVFGGDRFAVFADGTVALLPADEIHKALDASEAP